MDFYIGEAGIPRDTLFAIGQPVEVWWSSEKNPKDVAWYQTPMDITYKLAKQANLTVTDPDGTSMTTITVDSVAIYQTMQGIGASLEESTIYNLSRMSVTKREEVLRALVDPANGIGMNLMRICFVHQILQDVNGTRMMICLEDKKMRILQTSQFRRT